MKKMIRSLVGVAAVLVMLAIPLVSHAWVQLGPDGIWYGNICRQGPYFQVVPFRPLGSGCYLPSWNLYGVIVNE